MPIGELTIKNDDLGAIIGRVLEEEPGIINFDGTTTQEQFEEMIGTYAMDIVYSGWAAGKDLDFSYKTLSDLPVAVASCYQRNRNDRPEDIAVNGTIKALAAYFFTLSMNELECAVSAGKDAHKYV